jgi:ABC-type Fe3+/spermidine/putrescine transport system ATPase subunit
MAGLEVRNISKSFGKTPVLSSVSFKVEEGGFLSLLGPSGCGKTTMLRIIGGLEYPDGGSILADGQDITRIPAEKRNAGMVFQNYALIPHMTVYNNISYGLKIRKKSRREIETLVDEITELTGLSDLKYRRVTGLSGGQQQRVALARALVIKPRFLLLDEPLSALDRKIRGEMQYEIRRIQQEVGITAIFVTHDQEEAMTMSDTILLMNRGTIEQNSSPEKLYNHPVSLYASDFLGKANILPGRLEKTGGAWFVASRDWRFPIPETPDLREGHPVSAALRREQFLIYPEPREGANEALILDKIFAGPLCELKCRMGSDPVDVVCINVMAEGFRKGDRIYLSMSPHWVHYFDRPDA